MNSTDDKAIRSAISEALALGKLEDPRVVDNASTFLVSGEAHYIYGGDGAEPLCADAAVDDILWAIQSSTEYPGWAPLARRQIKRRALDALKRFNSIA